MNFFAKLLAYIPLRGLYFLADFVVYPFAYYVIRYRRKIVHKNIENSFPDKTETERKSIEKGFYHYFSDTIAEIIYGYRADDEDMRKRVQFVNLEQVKELTIARGGAFFMLGHVGNWEWAAEIGSYEQDFGVTQCNIYKQLQSSTFDRLMLDIRSKRMGFCCEKDKLLRVLITQKNNGQPTTYGMIADQKPLRRNIHYWTTFLHQETPFFSGVERLAKKFDFPVFFADVNTDSRGYYTIEFKLITNTPLTEEEFYITEKYARLLEENILRQPSRWLWSHNRWKHGTKAQFEETMKRIAEEKAQKKQIS